MLQANSSFSQGKDKQQSACLKLGEGQRKKCHPNVESKIVYSKGSVGEARRQRSPECG